MSEVKKCERCADVIRGDKALQRRTKYCDPCARVKKRENTESPWLPDVKRDYMREYMRKYRRAHPGLSSLYVRRHRERKSRVREEPSEGVKVSGDTTLRSLTLVAALSLLFLKGDPPESWAGNLENVSALIVHLQVLLVEVAGLVFVALICWRHLADFWRNRKK